MSDEAILEMLCDWTAMSLAKRTVMKDWYDSADDKSRIFSKNTKEIVDRIMNESWTSVIHLASLEGLK